MHRLAEPPPGAELVPENYCRLLDLSAVFERVAPVEVDLGCGDGSYLAQLAETFPAHDFLGIERLFGRVRSACHKLAERRLSNARVLRIETNYALSRLLPPQSVAVFHVRFPDPWPKRRHENRRLVNQPFLESIYGALCVGGTVQIATDQTDYFEAIVRCVDEKPDLFRVSAGELLPLPTSTFEKRFRDAGVPVHCLELRKLGGGT